MYLEYKAHVLRPVKHAQRNKAYKNGGMFARLTIFCYLCRRKNSIDGKILNIIL